MGDKAENARRGDKFSMDNMAFLCGMVEQLAADATDPEQLILILREVAEVAVWGDKFEETIFDMFLERKVVEHLARLVTSRASHVAVKIQCFQSITILLQNLTRQQSLYFV